jgi:hypothetical protein
MVAVVPSILVALPNFSDLKLLVRFQELTVSTTLSSNEESMSWSPRLFVRHGQTYRQALTGCLAWVPSVAKIKRN